MSYINSYLSNILQATIDCLAVPRCSGNLLRTFRYFVLVTALSLSKASNACPRLDVKTLQGYVNGMYSSRARFQCWSNEARVGGERAARGTQRARREKRLPRASFLTRAPLKPLQRLLPSAMLIGYHCNTLLIRHFRNEKQSGRVASLLWDRYWGQNGGHLWPRGQLSLTTRPSNGPISDCGMRLAPACRMDDSITSYLQFICM